MTKNYLGIIGGSGLYAIKDFELRERLEVDTPFGKPSSPLMLGRLGGKDVIFLARHGEGHLISPSEINFRANIWALKLAGVKSIFSVSAVGSLKEEIHPGHMVVVDQFIDRTTKRVGTFFENGIVAHVGFAHPVSSYLRGLLIAASKKLGVTCHEKGTYVCIEGPQFSTVAESHWYRSMGADVIGMTNLPEAKLAREAEIDYATLALSTDYDCWHPDHDAVTADQVVAVIHANIVNAQKILVEAVMSYDGSREAECAGTLKFAVLSNRDAIKPEVKARFDVLLGKYM